MNGVLAFAPAEPQSFLDACLVRLHRIQKEAGATVAASATDAPAGFPVDSVDIASEFSQAQRHAAHVITHCWADRFAEVEWPALVLVHWLELFAREHADATKFAFAPGLKAWPWEATVPPHNLAEDKVPLTDNDLLCKVRCSAFDLGLMIWLGWDTDHTDLDLHVHEPSGNEVYFGNRRSSIGGDLSRDFTQGYGPEVYLLKTPVEGDYAVKTKYYASHQDSALTGATSAVIWILHQQAASQGGGRVVQFSTARLAKHKESEPIAVVRHGRRPCGCCILQ